MRVDSIHLPYHERSGGKFRDLRSWEIRLPRRRFVRVSVNGQYRIRVTKVDPLGKDAVGAERPPRVIALCVFVVRRHCWHASVNVRARGVTLSYGRRIV